jgi:hypothetical protein
MQELVGRLTALDAEATESLKVIAYFDALVDGHASTEVLLRGAAVLSGCAAGFTADGTVLRVDEAGARSSAPAGEWPFHGFGDGGRAWIERGGAPHANDDMILERLAIALGIALERSSPAAASRRALQILIDPDASAEARLDAARRLRLDGSTLHRVVATPSDVVSRDPSVVVGTEVGPIRVAVVVAGDAVRPARAGVGIACVPDALPRSWASALVALRLSSAREPVVSADDLGVVLALAEAAPHDVPDVEALAALIRSQPGADTLLEAIASTESLRAAGVEVGLHHSTVQSKAAHFSEALGFDLRSPQGRVRLSLALALHRLATNRFG